jgi:hypothetical protein
MKFEVKECCSCKKLLSEIDASFSNAESSVLCDECVKAYTKEILRMHALSKVVVKNLVEKCAAQSQISSDGTKVASLT